MPAMLRVSLSETLRSALPAPDEKAKALRSITMVGAHVRGGELSIFDRMYLRKIFSVCAQKSVVIAPTVSVRVANLQYGHDFLTRPSGTDMVVFSYIYFEPQAARSRRACGFTSQSPHSAQAANWHDALVKTGARVAVNIYCGRGETELPTRFLSKPPYSHCGVYPCDQTKLKFAFLMR
jgi:hypothetical protein